MNSRPLAVITLALNASLVALSVRADTHHSNAVATVESGYAYGLELTELTTRYRQKRQELVSQSARFDSFAFKGDKEKELIEFLSDCAKEMRPGCFHMVTLNNCLGFDVSTKEKARQKALEDERQAYGEWQYELRGARREALRRYYGLNGPAGVRLRPDAAMVRHLGLTRYEDYYLRALPGWHVLSHRLEDEHSIHMVLSDGFRPAGERMPLPNGRELDAWVSQLNAITADTGLVDVSRFERTFWSDERLLPVWRAFETVLEYPESPDLKRLKRAAMSAVVAHPDHERLGVLCKELCLWTTNRLTAVFGFAGQIQPKTAQKS